MIKMKMAIYQKEVINLLQPDLYYSQCDTIHLDILFQLVLYCCLTE